MVSVPPLAMASRRVDREVQDRALELGRVGPGAPQAAGQDGLDLRSSRPASGAAARTCPPPACWRRSPRICSGCWREKASRRWRKRRRPRYAGLGEIEEAHELGRRRAERRPIISMAPPMPIRRLLKSWAIPAVSWPTAFIFCDWRRLSSAFSRRSCSSCRRAALALPHRAPRGDHRQAEQRDRRRHAEDQVRGHAVDPDVPDGLGRIAVGDVDRQVGQLAVHEDATDAVEAGAFGGVRGRRSAARRWPA